MTNSTYSAEEMMTVAASHALRNGQVCFVGIGLPSAAANLARMTHAPDVVLIYESGTIATKPDVLPLSIGDGELCETALTTVSVPEIFRYWLQGGRIDVGFLGAAQFDMYGNINTTVIGDYSAPKVRLPGGGGAPEIASEARKIVVTLRHSKRTLVKHVDFITSLGFGRDGHSAPPRRSLGPVALITDLCVMAPEPGSNEFIVVSIHQGVTREAIIENTGWPVRFAPNLPETEAPTPRELEILRALHERTRAAHGEPE